VQLACIFKCFERMVQELSDFERFGQSELQARRVHLQPLCKVT